MKTIYRCEMCGEEFDDWQSCMAHENTHPEIIKTTPWFEKESELPTRLFVDFNNGCAGIYVLDAAMPPEKENPLADGKED